MKQKEEKRCREKILGWLKNLVETLIASAILCLVISAVVYFAILAIQDMETQMYSNLEDEVENEIKGDVVFTKNEKIVVAIDRLTYNGLVGGREYIVTAVLYNPETGEMIMDSEGNTAEDYKKFKAEDQTGEIDITFRFDTENKETNIDRLLVRESVEPVRNTEFEVTPKLFLINLLFGIPFVALFMKLVFG